MRWLAIVGLVAAIAAGIFSTHPAPRAGVAPQVSEAYAAVSALTPGALVVLAVDFDPAAVPELAPFVRLVLDAALMRGARVVTLSLSPQGAMLAERYLREAVADRRALYGRDAVNLGFIEGRGVAVHLLGLPLQRAVTRDHAGNAIADLALAKETARLDDAELVVVASNGQPSVGDWILQAGRFARSLVVATAGDGGAELAPFVASGQLAGLVSGARDVAAFADLAATDPRLHTDATSMSYLRRLAEQMRSQRWAHLVLVVFLVVGQGVTFLRNRKRVP